MSKEVDFMSEITYQCFFSSKSLILMIKPVFNETQSNNRSDCVIVNMFAEIVRKCLRSVQNIPSISNCEML